MMLRFVAAAGLAASVLFATSAVAATSKQRMETCKFGADNQKLTGAARTSFMSKCMSNKDSPRGAATGSGGGSGMPRPNPQ